VVLLLVAALSRMWLLAEAARGNGRGYDTEQQEQLLLQSWQ